jgi:hypothetical protein
MPRAFSSDYGGLSMDDMAGRRNRVARGAGRCRHIVRDIGVEAFHGEIDSFSPCNTFVSAGQGGRRRCHSSKARLS